jgi:hypothetical protein
MVGILRTNKYTWYMMVHHAQRPTTKKPNSFSPMDLEINLEL